MPKAVPVSLICSQAQALMFQEVHWIFCKQPYLYTCVTITKHLKNESSKAQTDYDSPKGEGNLQCSNLKRKSDVILGTLNKKSRKFPFLLTPTIVTLQIPIPRRKYIKNTCLLPLILKFHQFKFQLTQVIVEKYSQVQSEHSKEWVQEGK